MNEKCKHEDGVIEHFQMTTLISRWDGNQVINDSEPGEMLKKVTVTCFMCSMSRTYPSDEALPKWARAIVEKAKLV